MGERRRNRERSSRTDHQILASDDMAMLSEVARGRVALEADTRMLLRRLAREDLLAVGFATGQVATLLPRGQRLLGAARGEYTLPTDN